MSEMIGNTRKEALKKILRRLHDGESPQKLKEAFREAVGNVSPQEIAAVEEELVRDGVPREELMKLCDLHLALFEESLAGAEISTPPWHPLHILMAEHREMLAVANRLASRAREGVRTPEDRQEVEGLVGHLVGSESHYLREENVLFPYLERHGIIEPPKVMWAEHDRIRELKKAVVNDAPAGKDLAEGAIALSEMLASHFLKENRILFPSGLRVIPDGAWPEIRRQFDEIGYCCFTPAVPPPPEGAAAPARAAAPASASEFRLRFPTGEFTPQELEAVLNALPVDITFVDKDDTVRYFSASKDRIFVRTEAVLGRKVRDCHPPKSVHVVERIVSDFKAGRRDVAEFWIPFRERFVYIRYFPVRGRGGEYLGTVEVTQDIGPIQRISGERRLLDD
ncbi:MAG: Hemerythrin domain protein [Candidatus Bipolaricaulis sibiricus]|uniref:Hemerythrin domain protein n=1 Tax=Bipolaricaulis sibiricus TaxID=2501609 RepID=A0A410FU05_BIPS1|nr:MAG: Hemerythrin domain protein [Candidatus Bipolaricaulis sibiricus]